MGNITHRMKIPEFSEIHFKWLRVLVEFVPQEFIVRFLFHMTDIRACKYPASANLFSLCKSLLSVKFGSNRVIDQDVGQILDFDPADCSHWKHGRKNIKSFDEIRKISEKLGLDECFVIDVALGRIDESEAVVEMSLSSSSSTYQAVLDDLQAKFPRTLPRISHNGNIGEQLRTVLKNIDDIVSEIHENISFKEAPLYFPEILQFYPRIKFIENSHGRVVDKEGIDALPRLLGSSQNSFEVGVCHNNLNRPLARVHLARILYRVFSDLCEIDLSSTFTPEQQLILSRFYESAFADRILVPKALLRSEMGLIDLNRDVVGQLAERFWVTRSVINRRLKECLLI